MLCCNARAGLLLLLAAGMVTHAESREHPTKIVRRQGTVSAAGRLQRIAEKQAQQAAAQPAAFSETQSRAIYIGLKDQLYGGKDPYKLLEKGQFQVDQGYPMSNLKPEIAARVLKYTAGPKFWLEVGSFIGNSAITTAREIKKAGLGTSVIAVDPWSGDVNMWAWNKGLSGPNGFNYLEMGEDGAPRIYETFLANVKAQQMDDVILPVRASSLVGMRLLKRLQDENRLSELPAVIYLDSAHEKDETLMELQNAWGVLQNGGVLFGDDWGWPAVHNDVVKFAESLKLDPISPSMLQTFDITTYNGFHAAQQPVPGVVLVDYQWLILKPPRADESMEM